MSWFTENIRDPIEKKIAGTKPASPAVATTNVDPVTAANSGFMSAPWFLPVVFGAIVLFLIFKPKG